MTVIGTKQSFSYLNQNDRFKTLSGSSEHQCLLLGVERTKEEGCISYVFSRDLTEEGAFRIFEEWQSQEALDLHFASPHMAKFQQALGGIGIKEMAVKRYEVSSVGPLGG